MFSTTLLGGCLWVNVLKLRIELGICVSRTKELQNKFIKYLNQNENKFLVPNIYLLGSPFECDLIQVCKSMTYYEFEVKVTLGDYFCDFHKHVSKHEKIVRKKHDYLNNSETWKWRKREIPKPSKFFFVLPEDFPVDKVEFPSYAGVYIEDCSSNFHYKSFKLIQKPKKLKGSTLDTEQLFNIGKKMSCKL